ncbi:MAG: VOC family protein [Thermoplasmatales archaeon]|nr:VOC family protein [Thermoplasmatales archaeon]
MLSEKSVVTTIPVVDIERAKNFYENKLELKLLEEMDEGLFFEAGNNTQLYMYKRDSTKADHTVASFMVDDIENEVNHLKEKGIIFEEYDFPTLKTVNNIATTGNFKSAWFKDTEGNIIALTQMN